MRIAVAGGTGLVGSEVARQATAAGHDVVVLSRSNGVDLVAGTGVEEALDGVEAVVDATSTTSQDRAECVAFFGSVARHLQAAAAATGVRRVVTLSIIGIDRMPDRAHYAGKLAQEEATRAGAVPATILRATQFHDFGRQLISWIAKGPLMPCPAAPVQTVAVETVAAHLLRLAVGEDEGRTVQLAGPQRHDLRSQVRRTARADGRRLFVVPVWLPGASERAAREGAMLPGPDAVIDGPSFDDWLAG